MTLSEILQLVVQGGALVLLALVLIGLFLLLKPAISEAKVFFAGLVAEQKATREVLVQLAAEQRAGFAAVDQRLTLAEERMGGKVDQAAGKVADVTRTSAADLADRISDELARGPASSPATSGGERPAGGRRAAA